MNNNTLETEKRKREVEEAAIIASLGGYNDAEDKEIEGVYNRYINLEIDANQCTEFVFEIIKKNNLTELNKHNEKKDIIISELDAFRSKMKEELRDSYTYPDNNILINKFSIKDYSLLDRVEWDISKIKIFNIKNIEFGDFNESYVKNVHKYLFEDLYDFAGDFRTIQIFKPEKELGGISFRYANPSIIETELRGACNFYSRLRPSTFKSDQIKSLGKLSSVIWAIHPFREGNTRVVMCVAKYYAKVLDLEFSVLPLKENPMKFRDALLLNYLGEYSEPEKLRDILEKCVETGER